MDRKFRINPRPSIPACPKCGNAAEFVGKAAQVAEDCCEVWVECVCGFDPTAENTGDRVEDVWGSLDNDTLATALAWSWSEPITRQGATP